MVEKIEKNSGELPPRDGSFKSKPRLIVMESHRDKQVCFNIAINRYVNCSHAQLERLLKKKGLGIIERTAVSVLIAASNGQQWAIERVLYSNVKKVPGKSGAGRPPKNKEPPPPKVNPKAPLPPEEFPEGVE